MQEKDERHIPCIRWNPSPIAPLDTMDHQRGPVKHGYNRCGDFTRTEISEKFREIDIFQPRSGYNRVLAVRLRGITVRYSCPLPTAFCVWFSMRLFYSLEGCATG